MPDTFKGNMHKHKCTVVFCFQLKQVAMKGIFTHNTNKEITLKRLGRLTFDFCSLNMNPIY